MFLEQPIAMSTIFLKNTTGNRSGNFIRYEYGTDLFGYFFLDVYHGKKHVSKKIRTDVFRDAADFIRTLDFEICRKEDLNYLPEI